MKAGKATTAGWRRDWKDHLAIKNLKGINQSERQFAMLGKDGRARTNQTQIAAEPDKTPSSGWPEGGHGSPQSRRECRPGDVLFPHHAIFRDELGEVQLDDAPSSEERASPFSMPAAGVYCQPSHAAVTARDFRGSELLRFDASGKAFLHDQDPLRSRTLCETSRRRRVAKYSSVQKRLLR